MKTKQARKKTKKRKPDIRWMLEDDRDGRLMDVTFAKEEYAKRYIRLTDWRGVTPVKVNLAKVKP